MKPDGFRITLADSLVTETLITGIEQGSGYWARVEWPGWTAEDFDDPVAALQRGKTARYFDREDGTALGTLSIASLERGLQAMAARYPRHFANVAGDSHDAETGDVLVQLAVMGDIVYG